jgi:hypothetical protein
MKKETSATTIDLFREICRNILGITATLGILWMLYKFVEMAPLDDKMNVMLLVIGYLGGLVTGITTWYFGGAMRSAVAAALKGGQNDNPPEPPNLMLASNPVTDSKLLRDNLNPTSESGPATDKPNCGVDCL